MFEAMTYDNLMARMLDRIPDDMDKREGSVIWDALSPAALELELAYISLEYTLLEGFADTQEREYLVRRCAERGLVPYEATNAILKGVFTPSNVEVLGKRFSLDKLNYTVLSPIEGEPGAYQIQCENSGIEGGQYMGSLVPIEYVDNLETANAVEVLIPGEDEEETEALRERYFSNFRNKSYGGNVHDYLEKTNAIEGVGATKVIPIWAGAGTVKLTILNSDFDKASALLIGNVQDEIDPLQDGKGSGIAPIGHIVTVDTVTEEKINVSTSIECDVGYAWQNVENMIVQVISEYLLELRKNWGNVQSSVVRIAQIETRLLNIQGIVDVWRTSINGKTENLTLDSASIPIMGVVSNE
ncbi:MAG: baseplate J/gp47 family protein [Clostridiales bacterium]|nr:baseplate J/gp47 family protein [Clostridiales bacterium]